MGLVVFCRRNLVVLWTVCL